jgi:hypothetical protein
MKKKTQMKTLKMKNGKKTNDEPHAARQEDLLPIAVFFLLISTNQFHKH